MDYTHMYARLSRLLERYRGVKQGCYVAILLLQLRNGLRIGEAVDAFKEYLLTGKRELYVRVEKKKREEVRLVVVPQELTDLDYCWDLYKVEKRRLVDRVKHWCIYNLGVNTHSLRYAFITYLLRQGVSPSIIGKITRHSKLDYILTYTQVKAAEDVLRNML